MAAIGTSALMILAAVSACLAPGWCSPRRGGQCTLDREGITHNPGNSVRTGDDFERLMLHASSQMHSPLPGNRRAAGNGLRKTCAKARKGPFWLKRRAVAEPPVVTGCGCSATGARNQRGATSPVMPFRYVPDGRAVPAA